MSVDELRAIEGVKKVKAQYFYFLDTKQWDELRSIFTDDVDFDSAKEGEYQFDGLDGFISFVRANLPEATTVHHGHMPIIEVSGPNDASAIWAMMDYVESPRGKFFGYGHYHETYRREQGVWKISSWKLTRLRVDPQ